MTTTVSAGQSAVSSSFVSGGSLTVFSGGLARDDTFSTNTVETVSSGGTDSGGVITYFAAQAVTGSGARVVSDTIGRYSSQTVESGGRAIATLISGLQASGRVLAGGATTGTKVADGLFVVEQGGSAVSTTAIGGGAEFVEGGSATSSLIIGGEQYVSGGGVAVDTVFSGGEQTLEAGGIASVGTLADSATATIWTGGSAVSESLGGGASLSLVGGTAVDTRIGQGGYMVDESGTAIDTSIGAGGGLLLVNSGGSGVASGTTIDGGTEYVNAGVDSNDTVEGGGIQHVQFGAQAISAIVESGGTQAMVDAGDASFTTLEAGGRMVLSGGGIATSPLIARGGLADAAAGGVMSDATVEAGGTLAVLAGATLDGATIASGGFLVVLPGASLTDVSGAGVGEFAGEALLSRGALLSVWTNPISGVTVVGNDLYVLHGGAVTDIHLSGSAVETVASGARDVGTEVVGAGTQESWGYEVDSYATLTVSGSAYGETASSGGVILVQAGGVATSVTLGGMGQMHVDKGGSAAATVVNSGGDLIVSSGGAASDAELRYHADALVSGLATSTQATLAGDVEVGQGGTAAATTLGLLSEMTVGNGGVGSDVTLDANLASLVVSAGGTFEGTIDIAPGVIAGLVLGGTLAPDAVVSGFTGLDTLDLPGITYEAGGSATYANGKLDVVEGGQTYDLQLAGGPDYAEGRFRISQASGGIAVNFLAPSSEVVSGGQSATDARITSGAVNDVLAGGTNIDGTLEGGSPFITYQGNTIDGGTLLITGDSPGLAVENNQGVDSGSVIGRGGNMINVGSAFYTTVTSGGLLFDEDGALDGVNVDNDGIELVLGLVQPVAAIGGTIDGGLQGLAGPARAIDATVSGSGGEQVVGGQITVGGEDILLPAGVAIGTTVEAGGAQYVNAGGVASATSIETGGRMVVNSLGAAETPLIGGGTLVLNSGAVVMSGIRFNDLAGTLEVAGTVGPATSITGFGAGDVIDLQGLAPGGHPGVQINTTSDVLTVTGGSTSATLTLTGSYSGVVFRAIGDGGAGTDVAIACFVAGTRIATVEGETAVEALRVGERVRTAGGGARAVRWIGWRRVQPLRHKRPATMTPLRIAAGAFGPGLPRRDLLLSPDHAVAWEDVLIPVRCLANGTTIAPVAMDAVTYWHVELDRHDVVLAEGLGCESFLDTGNRAAFANGGAAVDLYPNFALLVWQAEACAELVLAGPRVAAARRWLAAQSGETGIATSLRRVGGRVQGGS